MDAAKRIINDILNGNRVLEVPFFQRAYVWGEDQWERLLEDMEHVSATNKPYFLGSVILKQKGTSSGNRVGDVRILIDGQQRLTTLSIFLRVYSLMSSDIYQFDRMCFIKEELSIQHNQSDLESFERVMRTKELTEIAGEDKITKAYSYFKNKIDISRLNLDVILNRIMFVVIDLDESEDEQQIFDTINSLGVKLTTAELLKNYLFNRNDITLYNDYWRSVFEKDEESREYWELEITTGRTKRTLIDLFFHSFLQIKIHEEKYNVRTDDKLEFSKVEQLFGSFKRFLKEYLANDINSLVNEIREYALLFRGLFNHGVIDEELTDKPGIDRVNAIIFGLETSTLIPYLLYVRKWVEDEKQRNDLFEYLESYIMRRLVTHSNTKNYNLLFMDKLINNQIISKSELITYLEERADKINRIPTDEELKDGFYNSRLINKQALGILYFIESKIRNRRLHSTRLLGLNKYSLEHLMPKKWENNWPKPHAREDVERRNRKLLTLGNLAIIPQNLNSSIRDANWKVKLEGKGDRKGLLAYAAGLETMNGFMESQDWNESSMDARAEYLFSHAKEIWKLI